MIKANESAVYGNGKIENLRIFTSYLQGLMDDENLII